MGEKGQKPRRKEEDWVWEGDGCWRGTREEEQRKEGRFKLVAPCETPIGARNRVPEEVLLTTTDLFSKDQGHRPETAATIASIKRPSSSFSSSHVPPPRDDSSFHVYDLQSSQRLPIYFQRLNSLFESSGCVLAVVPSAADEVDWRRRGRVGGRGEVGCWRREEGAERYV